MANQTESIPTFFTNDFFSKILQQNEQRIDVKSFTAVTAVAPGNNYSCVVYRVRVTYKADNDDNDNETSLIIKTPLADGKARDIIAAMGFIEKECIFYKEVSPLMDAVLHQRITPTSYVSTEPGTVILEDLSSEGYDMCDCLKQLDFEHCNLFMERIAVFHASSVHINKHNPELIERVGKECIYKTDCNEDFKQFYNESTSGFAAVLEKWGGFDNFVDLYKNHGAKLLDQAIIIHNTKKHLRVLNHGDAWTNNMLFKYDDTGRVVDMKLIDLQVCTFSSPAIDLITFIVSSAQEDVKDRRLPELYTTYLKYLNSTLESLGCDERLSADELQDELKFTERLSLCLLISYLPMVLNDKNNVMDMAKAVDAMHEEYERNPWMKAFNGETYKTVAKYTLRKLNTSNLFASLI